VSPARSRRISASGKSSTARRSRRVQASGWTLLRFESDVRSGRSDRNRNRDRDGLRLALATCRSKEADALMVAKLDRLSRSVVEAATLIKKASTRAGTSWRSTWAWT
jgi:DNA invertase Pin-like site-specific DNA recombinase